MTDDAEAAIRRVLARYAVAVDRCDLGLVASCYHPDAIEDRGRYVGPLPGFLDWLAGTLAELESTWHMVGLPYIEFDGETALVESYCLAVHGTRAGESEPPAHRLIACRYRDRFECRGGDWRIASRVAVYEPGF